LRSAAHLRRRAEKTEKEFYNVPSFCKLLPSVHTERVRLATVLFAEQRLFKFEREEAGLDALE
jgi:hypothetical protein